ncbi:ABC transporter ATP-binding protein [uncultured Desulfuromonas sp.]|uniref:ABC transporter ATP-binding protein n=1 Tax=uncultured Desulfuromonas sp. TaxID=181013 RepID=UPI002AAACF7E|nr:ABC transporter ATP-binding protein [uncultured Desulfuromonas sp.]
MLIDVADISKAYAQGDKGESTPAVEGLSFAVAEGEFVCIIGPSGCGKSTLLNMLAGFIAPDRGTICFDGHRINCPDPQRAVVFQDAILFPWMNLRRNLELGLKAAGATKSQLHHIVNDSLALVDLKCSQKAYPHQLSGGMKQRAALARVLALQPRLLLMDEPFSALDAETREHLQDQLLKICAQRRQTVVFVTHSVEEAAYLADRVIIMGHPPNRCYATLRIQRELARSRTDKQQRANILRLRAALRDFCRQVPDGANAPQV